MAQAGHGVDLRRGTAPANIREPMTPLLLALEAFLAEHRRCGTLDAGVSEEVVWMACECGARLARATQNEQGEP